MDHEVIKKLFELELDRHIYEVDHSKLSMTDISQRISEENGYQALLAQQDISSPASDALDYLLDFLGSLFG